MPYPAAITQASQAVPPLGFRFSASFLAGDVIHNPLDIYFRKVSGIGSTIRIRTVEEGGQNLYSHRLPEKVQYENLILERGLAVGSLLAAEFNVAMSQFQFSPCNVLVSLLDETGIVISSWLFMKAYPVKWKITDLDADQNQVVIETMELAYQRMQPTGI